MTEKKKPEKQTKKQTVKQVAKKSDGKSAKKSVKKNQKKTVSQKKNSQKKNKTWLIVLVCMGVALVGILGGIYIYKAEYFSKHFYEGTKINGVDCSDMTEEEAEATIQDRIDEYTLTILERGGQTEVLTAGELQMIYRDDGKVGELLKQQHPWNWLMAANKPQAFEVAAGFEYDVEGLGALVDGLLCVTEYTAPSDACMIQETDGSWSIVPESEGNQVNRDQVYTVIKEAIEAGKTEISLEERGCYLRPAVYSDDAALNQEVGRLNMIHNLTRANISVRIESQNTAETLDRTVLTEWIADDGSGNLFISRDALGSWIQNLSDTWQLTGKKDFFRTTGGQLLTLTEGDAYGWSLDVEKTTDVLYQAICEGFQGEMNMVYSRISYSGAENGGTYVEISIDQQKMWCYQDGALKVETPVVTGDLSVEGRATPKGGIWSVKWKTHPYHMKGPQREDGTYEYETDVDYWIPFNDDVGIHDLSSRTEFGGEIYLTNGSHGCINTPYEAVQQIYEIVEKGTPVIVY